ncbi:hypothetical protein G7A66_03075 [Altererythrobacter sp. SALINAS58]|uniref:hypothetical protein n=1 Tax=Alteripontixanthobacter muriae TaxID=2705546 RepID=UPI001576D9C2|nr:hypothetical protein [Alteripontixanthobacter muriae]NTZ42092.1 hypothetical protein [Alteripontixanthobacter muriae]
MIRRILTLLALMTGLAATAAPAGASVAEALAGRIEAGEQGQGVEAAVLMQARLTVASSGSELPASIERPLAISFGTKAPVLLPVDRAHE